MTESRRAALILLLAAACGDSGVVGTVHGPRILTVTPEGRVQGTRAIEIEFDAEAEARRVGRELALSDVALVDPPLEASARFTRPNTLVLRPRSHFAPATRYRFTLRADVLGSALLGRRSFEVWTPAFGLDDARAWRRDGRIAVALGFSHPVHPAEAEAALVVRASEGGPPLPTRALDDAVGHRVLFSVEAPSSPESVHIELVGELRAAAGGRSLGKTVQRSLALEAAPPVVHRVRAAQLGARWALSVDLAQPVSLDQFAASLGGVGSDVQLARGPSGPWILGGFEPGSRTSLRLGPPLMPVAETFPIRFPELEPSVRIVSERERLDLPPGARLEVEHHGVRGLEVGVEPALGRTGRAAPGATLRVEAHPSGRTSIDIGGLVDALGPGLHRVKVSDVDRPWLSSARTLGRRGLQLVVKRRPGYVWALVTDAVGPVASATVRLLGSGGSELARGKSGRDGTLSLRFDEGRATQAVATTEEGAFAVLPFDARVAVSGSEPPRHRVWMVPDRAIAAPGQAIDVSILIEDARRRPGRGHFVLEMVRRMGERVAATTLDADSVGAGRVELPVPAHAEAGTYLLLLRDGAGQLVARSRVDIPASEPFAVAPIEGLRFELRGASSAAVRVRCRYRVEARFGGLPPLAAPPVFGPHAVEVDGQGQWSCPSPPDAARPWRVWAEAHGGGRGDAEASVLHAPRARYAAFLPVETPVEAGQALDLPVRVVDGAGRPAAGTVDVAVRSLGAELGARVTEDARVVPHTWVEPGEPEVLTLALERGEARLPYIPPKGGSWRLEAEGAEPCEVWVGSAESSERPTRLSLARVDGEVRAALPFAGTLLLTAEQLEVERAELSPATERVVVEAKLPTGPVVGVLLGGDGRWSSARLGEPQAEPEAAPIELQVPSDLTPGQAFDVGVRVRGQAWGGLFRLLLVDAQAAPDAERLPLGLPPLPADGLDTLTGVGDAGGAASMVPPPPLERARARAGRPGRVFVSTPWLNLGANGAGYARIRWPEASGRIRVLALVRAGGRYGIGSVERIVGDGVGVDVRLPSVVRVGDRIAVPVAVDNGAERSVSVSVTTEGEGFDLVGGSPTLTVGPGERAERRVVLQARASGPLDLRVGESRLEREVERIGDRQLHWSGRGASASYRAPALLPTPEQLDARAATLVVAESPITRFAGALIGAFARAPRSVEEAAALVMQASLRPELTRALGFEGLESAQAWLPRGLESEDPWLRTFVAHAVVDGKVSELEARAWQVLAEVATRSADAEAAAYARLLLTRARRPLPPDSLRADRPQRLDGIALAAAADVLERRAAPVVLEELGVAATGGPRRGRFSPALLDAVALWALEVARPGSAAAEGFVSAVSGAARDGTWAFPAEQAFALLALETRAKSEKRRPYWGSVLVDGELVQRFNAQRPLVLDLERLDGRPEVTVTGAGVAEIGLGLARTEPPPPPTGVELSVQVRTPEGGERLLEGERFVLEVSLSSAAAEALLLDLPTFAGAEPAGPLPAGARRRAGGLSWYLELDAGETFRAEVPMVARFAGVWRAPPASAQMAHGRGTALAPIGELRVDSP